MATLRYTCDEDDCEWVFDEHDQQRHLETAAALNEHTKETGHTSYSVKGP